MIFPKGDAKFESRKKKKKKQNSFFKRFFIVNQIFVWPNFKALCLHEPLFRKNAKTKPGIWLKTMQSTKNNVWYLSSW